MKKQMKDRMGDFMAGKGFYIVLFLCVAAIGISGYYLFSTTGQDSGPDTAVVNPVSVTVTPTPAPSTTPIVPVKPEISTASPRPVTTPRPSAAVPVPSTTPAPNATPVPTSTVFTWPVKGEVIHPFSLEVLVYDNTMGDWRTHSGLDIACEQGTRVRAAAGGKVSGIDMNDMMGTTLSIDHGNGVVSHYSNLTAVPAVAVGDVVTTGDYIGAIGSTAIAESASPSHLHFEITKDGLSADPTSYLPERQS